MLHTIMFQLLREGKLVSVIKCLRHAYNYVSVVESWKVGFNLQVSQSHTNVSVVERRKVGFNL